MGALIAKLGEQVPLALSTPANRVSWSNRDVTVETSAGKIVARAAIVTVSSNVLAAGNIKFTPDIPKRQLDAAAKLSLGSLDRIVLQLQGNPLGLARDDIIVEQSDSTRTALLLASMAGSSLCAIDVGGSFGRDLSAQGEAAMVAFAKEWLTKLFGSEAAAAVKKSSATRWNAAPFTLGAMSSAAPGGQGSRKILTEPFGCMFLAGEATHETLWGTVDGAWESGERAAEAALRRIGALKDEPAAPAQKQRRRSAREIFGSAHQLKPSRPKALISWSSGKDSAFALHEIRRSGEFDVVGALTTVTETFERVSIHGVRREILLAQLDAAGLPPRIVPIPYPVPERNLRSADGRGGRASGAGRHHPHHFRRSLPRRYPRLSRSEARGHRHYAGVSAVAAADPAAGACDDRQRARGVSRHRRSETFAGGIRGPQIRCVVAGGFACGDRSLRRERRVSYLRGGGADFFAAACRW